MKAIHGLLGIDVASVFTDAATAKKFFAPVMFVDALYITCREQCETRGMNDIDFAKAIVGDVIDDAREAFEQALIASFPKDQRTKNAALLAKGKSLVAEVMPKLLAQIEAVTINDLALNA